MVAITPQTAEFAAAVLENKKLDFDLLLDPGNEYAAALGLRFEFPDKLKQLYTNFGLDLSQQNGDDSWTLPVPARIVADSSGIVRAVDADPDYTRRPEPDKTLADVRAISSKG